MQKLHNYIISKLVPLYGEVETEALELRLWQYERGFSRFDLHVHRHDVLDSETTDRLFGIADRLSLGEPIQYIYGEAPFFDFMFKVTPAVLIPRPETEELVDAIVKANPGFEGRIADIGTGSGCIAVSLKSFLPQADVTGFDISREALEVAQNNAIRNSADVSFVCADVLSPSFTFGGSPDIVVSNPPYITLAEMKEMHSNVLDFEPHLALFVSDDDPLLFYRVIASKASEEMASGGQLWFEINRAYPAEMAALLGEYGFTDVEVRKDLFGNHRIAVCTLK